MNDPPAVLRADWSNLPGRVLTKSVFACETGSWSLLSWPRRADGSVNLACLPSYHEFRCGSWRCRRCRRRVGAQDFVRVAAATKRRTDWYYAVLTVDPAHWEDRWGAFSGCYRLWQDRLRKRLERWARGFSPGGGRLEYVMTFERHSSGWPHINILMAHDGLSQATEVMGVVRRKKGRARTGRECDLPKWRSELVDAAVGSGFGRVVWLERVKDAEQWAGYLTKLAAELVGADVKSQVPVGAPKGFRRLRSTRGTLPPTFAQLRAGELSERVWAMDSKRSPEDWAYWEREKPGRTWEEAKNVFDNHGSEGENLRLEERFELGRVARMKMSPVELVEFAELSADHFEEISTWNRKARSAGAMQASPS